MDRQALNKRIIGIRYELDKLTTTLRAMETTDITQDPKNYELLSTDAALRSELITCRLRRLIYETTETKKQEYLASTGVVMGIEIEVKDGILEITIPSLIPKNKRNKNTDFLTDPLYFTLQSYAYTHGLPQFEHCVVCFAHVYDETLSIRRTRDYDNLELKQILDVISSFVMQDDAGLLCDAYNTTELGPCDCTRVTVMPREHFPAWLEERKNRLKTISGF